MIRWLAAILLVLLCSAGCASVDQDIVGNTYPPECSQEATDKVTVPVLYAAQGSPLLPHFNGMTTLGYMHTLRNGAPIFLAVDEHLGGWKRKDVLRHERCHVIAGHWHK